MFQCRSPRMTTSNRGCWCTCWRSGSHRPWVSRCNPRTWTRSIPFDCRKVWSWSDCYRPRTFQNKDWCSHRRYNRPSACSRCSGNRSRNKRRVCQCRMSWCSSRCSQDNSCRSPNRMHSSSTSTPFQSSRSIRPRCNLGKGCTTLCTRRSSNTNRRYHCSCRPMDCCSPGSDSCCRSRRWSRSTPSLCRWGLR